MFNSTSGLTPTDVLALNNNDGFGGGNSWFWLIILIALFGGWGGNGFGFGRGGVQQDYVLTSDIATIERKLDEQNNGICNLGYTQAQLINGVQVNQMQNTNAIQTQLADCCCKTQSGIERVINQSVLNANAIQTQMAQCCCDNKAQIADLKYTMATENCATRQAIADSTKAIIDKMTADRIDALTNENNALKLSASQHAQNAYLVNQLRPAPVPAYNVPAPYFYGFGTTIA